MSQEEIYKFLKKTRKPYTLPALSKKFKHIAKCTVQNNLNDMMRFKEVIAIKFDNRTKKRLKHTVYKINKQKYFLLLLFLVLSLTIQGCGVKTDLSDYCKSQCEGDYLSYLNKGNIICKCTSDSTIYKKNEIILNCSVAKMQMEGK